MKVLSLSTAIFSAFLAASSLARAAASGVEATIIEHKEEKQIKTQEKLYLRQNPLVHPNNLIATSDSDAADSSTTADPNDLIATSDSDAADSSTTTTTTAEWLFTDEQQEIELSQNGTSTGGGGGGINWRVDGFGFYETIFVSCFAAYLVVIKVLWNTFIMKPMKLIAVFVHGKFSM